MGMLDRNVLDIAAKCPENTETWKNLIAHGNGAGLGDRDMRDLLIEYGCDGITATELVAGR